MPFKIWEELCKELEERFPKGSHVKIKGGKEHAFNGRYISKRHDGKTGTVEGYSDSFGKINVRIKDGTLVRCLEHCIEKV